jgi:hypothetical protein
MILSRRGPSWAGRPYHKYVPFWTLSRANRCPQSAMPLAAVFASGRLRGGSFRRGSWGVARQRVYPQPRRSLRSDTIDVNATCWASEWGRPGLDGAMASQTLEGTIVTC